MPSARRHIGRLLDENLDVTALITANSLLAEAAFSDLRARRISMPERISLVAYDDIPWMTMVRPAAPPSPSTRRVIGRCSVDTPLRRIEEDHEEPAMTILVQPTLVLRDSIAPPLGLCGPFTAARQWL